MIVVDASVVVDYLLDRGPLGVWSAARVAGASSLHAPHLLDLEVLSTIRRSVARGLVSPELARTAVADLDDLAVERHPIVSLLGRLWELRATLTPYDAAYVALAEWLEAPLATTDRRLARSHGHRAEIVAPAS